MLLDQLTKDLLPNMFREQLAGMDLWEFLWFLYNKGLVKNLFQNREVYCSC
jgi:hypothetical protein